MTGFHLLGVVFVAFSAPSVGAVPFLSEDHLTRGVVRSLRGVRPCDPRATSRARQPSPPAYATDAILCVLDGDLAYGPC